MTLIANVLQAVIALGIINVWVLRYGTETPWRPEGARNMAEEFRQYGLPDWTRPVVGAAKLSLALLLLFGIGRPAIAAVASAGMTILMAAAILAHLRIRDPLSKAFPSFVLFCMSLIVFVTHS